MKTLGCFLVFTCILAAIPAYADSDLTIFGAAQHQGKLTLQFAQPVITSNFNPTTFGVFGIRYSHGKVIGGEHTLAYAPNFISSNSKAFIYNSDLLLQVPLPKIRPYGVVGLGSIFTWSKNDTGRPALGDIGNKFAINYGGGVKILPAGPVGVQFDIRGYTLPSVKFTLPFPSVNPSLGAVVQTQSQSVSFIEYGFGVVFKF